MLAECAGPQAETFTLTQRLQPRHSLHAHSEFLYVANEMHQEGVGLPDSLVKRIHAAEHLPHPLHPFMRLMNLTIALTFGGCSHASSVRWYYANNDFTDLESGIFQQQGAINTLS